MVDFYDPRGNVIERKTVNTPQTADIAELHREFTDHPVQGLTPQKVTLIMSEAERGNITAQSDMYQDMEEKDGHIMAELGKRKRAVLGYEWSITAPNNATPKELQVAEKVAEIMEAIPDFETVLLGMGDAIGNGYSCLEISWHRNQHWSPRAIRHQPPRWFLIDQDNHNKLLLRDGSMSGVDLWTGGWIVHKHQAKSGDLARSGLHRALIWPFLFKNYSVRDLAEFLEIYGLPVRLGKYPTNADENQKMTLLQAVVNMGHAAAGIIPQGMEVDFKEAAKGGSDPYMAMIDWCERTQSKVILGGTLTSQADGASSTNALGNIHNEVRKELSESDAMQYASTLTRDLVHVICQLNGWADNPYRLPKFEFNLTENESLALLADAIPKLVDIGFKIGEDYLHEKSGIPKPKEGEDILERHAVQSLQPIDQSILKSKLTEQEKLDLADKANIQLKKNIAPVMDDMIDDIKKLTNEADDFNALKIGLDKLQKMDVNDFALAMQTATSVAKAGGVIEVTQEGE